MNTHPLSLTGSLDEPLSRWRWLVKWLLAIPHFVVLAFLWLAFALLDPGRVRRPALHRPLPAVDLRVQRRRAPLELARLVLCDRGACARPVPAVHASRRAGLPGPSRASSIRSTSAAACRSIGWWLVGIPQYAIAGLLGGGFAFGWVSANWTFHTPGVVGILMLVVGVLLLLGRGYPAGIFDLVMGLNRWTLRVVTYGAFLTTEYPPFRLDQGGDEPTPFAGVAQSAGPTPGRCGGRCWSITRSHRPLRTRAAVTPTSSTEPTIARAA